jgi:hypothetical protein
MIGRQGWQKQFVLLWRENKLTGCKLVDLDSFLSDN